MTQISFSNITGKIRFIDNLKYYQKSLAELASTLSDEEKISVKKLIGHCIREKRRHTLQANYQHGIVFSNS